MATEPRQRWTESEWVNVASIALPMIESGMHKLDALDKAQRKAIPKSRHRSRQSFAVACAPSSGTYDRAAEKARALQSEAVEAAQTLAPTTPPPAPEKRASADPGASATPSKKLEVDPLLADAAVAFGQTMMGALGELLAAHDAVMAYRTERMVDELPNRIGAVIQQLLQVQVQHIGAQVEQALRGVLLQGLGAAPAVNGVAHGDEALQ